MGVAAELMAQHAERAGGVAESAGSFLGGVAFEEEGPQGLVETVPGQARLEEEEAAIR